MNRTPVPVTTSAHAHIPHRHSAITAGRSSTGWSIKGSSVKVQWDRAATKRYCLLQLTRLFFDFIFNFIYSLVVAHAFIIFWHLVFTGCWYFHPNFCILAHYLCRINHILFLERPRTPLTNGTRGRFLPRHFVIIVVQCSMVSRTRDLNAEVYSWV